MTWLNERAPVTAAMVTADPDLIPVEKGIPLPPRRVGRVSNPGKGRGAEVVYPWDKMEVGDSFRTHPRHTRSAIQSAAYGFGCRLGRDFSLREMDDGTIRVWRTG
jgi:hypothetical protein